MEEAFPFPSDSDVPPRPEAVEVITTARLHFGFLDPGGRGPRPFGSIGLALDRPVTKLTLGRAARMQVRGPEQDRAAAYLSALTKACGLARGYSLQIEQAIPSHSGLGSGTQLALAIGAALSRIEGLALSPRTIAERLERGRRSGIGIATFAQGGMVLDGGPGPGGALPPLLCRLPFPPLWRALLIFDETSTGLHGEEEKAAFAELPCFPERETAELCRRMLQCALPALAEEDFSTFCDQIGYMQAKMGAYFSPLQGGAYISRKVAAALHWLAQQGASGIGQSSWGPTGFAFAPSARQAEEWLKELRRLPDLSGIRLEVAQGRNEGAQITAR